MVDHTSIIGRDNDSEEATGPLASRGVLFSRGRRGAWSSRRLTSGLGRNQGGREKG